MEVRQLFTLWVVHIVWIAEEVYILMKEANSNRCSVVKLLFLFAFVWGSYSFHWYRLAQPKCPHYMEAI